MSYGDMIIRITTILYYDFNLNLKHKKITMDDKELKIHL